MAKKAKARKLTDAEADTLFHQLAEGIVLLHDESEVGYEAPNHARALYFALAAFLDGKGIILHLDACARFIASKGGHAR